MFCEFLPRRNNRSVIEKVSTSRHLLSELVTFSNCWRRNCSILLFCCLWYLLWWRFARVWTILIVSGNLLFWIPPLLSWGFLLIVIFDGIWMVMYPLILICEIREYQRWKNKALDNRRRETHVRKSHKLHKKSVWSVIHARGWDC